MTDGQSLLLVLWLLYGAECLLWVDRGSTVFVTWFGAAWRARQASKTFGTGSGGLLLLNPVPGVGQCLEARVLPFWVSPSHVVSASAPASGPRGPAEAVALDGIESADARGAFLHINGAPFCRFPGPAEAAEAAGFLAALAGETKEAREKSIARFWARRFDLRRARRRRAIVLARGAVLSALCSIQFACIFLLFPLLCFRFGIDAVFLPAAGCALGVGFAISLSYARLRARSAGKLGGSALKLALYPLAGPRAADNATREALGGFEAMALAALVLDEARRDAFLEASLRALRHPVLPQEIGAAARDTMRWQGAAIERAARNLPGIARCAAAADAGPAKRDAHALSYCPRCCAQFAFAAGERECSDCPGVPLRGFAGS